MAIQQRPGNELSQLSLGEMLAGVIVVVPLLGALPLLIGNVRHRAWAWLIDHQVVVPAARLAIVDGIGLDTYRILILVGLLGFAVTIAYSSVRRRLSQRPAAGARQ